MTQHRRGIAAHALDFAEQKVQVIIRLLKTVVGAICVTTTVVLSALIMQELLSAAPASTDYAEVAMVILIGGLIAG